MTDYLEGSKTWEVRHEWIHGRLWAVAGGSPRHAAVSVNVASSLWQKLRGSSCRPTSSDQRLYVAATGAWLYPDVTVICGPYRTAPDDARSITNPTVLIEVLSPSTEAYDKRAKFEHYRHIESLLDVVWIAPEQEAVVHLARTEGGWLRRDLTEGEVHFTGLPGISLAFSDIYADLDNVPVTAEAKRPTAPDADPDADADW